MSRRISTPGGRRDTRRRRAPRGVGLFFANAETIREHVLEAVDDHTRAVVIAGETIPPIDLSPALMLEQRSKQLRDRGVRLVVAHPIGVRANGLRSWSSHPWC